MKEIMNRIGEIRLTPIRFFGFWAILFALVFTLCSCDDDLDVQQSYPFTVDVMPYADKIANGETIELRFTIIPEGNYSNTLYTIRYFQFEGDGTLQLVGGHVLVDNDRVILDNKVFRLNYTAQSADSHEFTVYIEDNWGTRWEQSFEFNNEDSDDDGEGGSGIGTIVGPVTPILVTSND